MTTVCQASCSIWAQPDRGVFWQKDAQQVQVIKRMVKDLFFNVQLRIMPIVREADGLAKSSRNTYLSQEERTAGLILSKSLRYAEELLSRVSVTAVELQLKLPTDRFRAVE